MAVLRQYLTAASGGVVNPQTGAFPQNTVNPSMIYVLTVSTVDTQAVTGITDTHGNSYTSVFDIDTGTYRFEFWKAPNTTAGANTVSVQFSAVAAASVRIYIMEVLGMGTPTDGPSNSLDISAAEDPLTLATLNTTDDVFGIAFTVVRTDGNFTLATVPFVDTNGQWTDMGGSITARAAFIHLAPGITTLAPTMDLNATNTGESMTVAMYDQDQHTGSGGGEHSAVF